MNEFTTSDYEALGLGPTVGDTKRCTYMVQVGERCELVAMVHALITANTFDNISACGKHWPVSLRTMAPLQWHPIAEDCGVPGAVWDTETNECRFEPFVSMEVFADQEVPEPVGICWAILRFRYPEGHEPY